MGFFLIVAVAALVAAQARGRSPSAYDDRIEQALASRWMPLVVALLWAVVIACTWGTLRPMPVYHDEISYLFQARLFAEGRWTAPSPPLADVWAQAHVLVSPLMASKYPPGHALLLSLGELVGAPGAMVLLLAALRGALVFVLARRLANGAIALATSVLLLHGDALHWGASFFSETTTGALVLVCWYALLRWREARHTRWIALLALALGWCAITRPASAVAFAIPVAVVVLRDVWRTRRWRDLGVAFVIGTAIVALLPLWSARTTGDWRLWPVTQYTRDYMPYDYPHFGVVDAQPRRELPGDLALIAPSLQREERNHVLSDVPNIITNRMAALATVTWWGAVAGAVLALVGVLAVPAAAWVGIATVATLFVAYLAHPSWVEWTIYYMEIAPVLVFLSVCGLARLFHLLSTTAFARADWRRMPRATRPLVLTALLALAFLVPGESAYWRSLYRAGSGYQRDFRVVADQVPGPAIVFVRHARWHSPHISLITNGPDWERAAVWVVADRGDARNAALLRLAPGRRGFLYDEGRSMIDLYQPAGSR